MSCITETIVGLAPTPPSCFTDDQPSEYNTSETGYHIYDPEFGLTVAGQCQVPGWSILSTSRTKAIRDVLTDLPPAISNNYEPTGYAWTSHIGKMGGNGGPSVPVLAWIGHEYKVLQHRRNTYLRISAVHLGVMSPGTYTVQVVSNDPTFVAPAPVTITVTAPGQYAKTASPDLAWRLPLWSEAVDGDLIYYINYNRGTALPLYNNFSCCGSEPAWKNVLEVSGFEGTDSDSLVNRNGLTNGLSVVATLTCDGLAWLCSTESLMGYELKSVIGRTVQMRAAAIAIGELINRFGVNPCTQQNLAEMQARRNWLNEQYSTNIAWIAANVPPGNGCWKCRDDIESQTILT